MVERANVLYHLAKDTRTLHRFDKLIWKVTDVTGSQVQVPLQFGSHLCKILQVLFFKGSSLSILEPRCPWEVLIFRKKNQEIYADAELQLTSHPVPPLRFSFANGQEDVSTSVLLVPYLPWKVIFLYSSAERARTSVVGSRCARGSGTCRGSRRLLRVFLSHLKLEDTVERLPSRHLALSLCLEDVKAQCDSLTPQTRERLQGVLSQREVDISTNVSLAHAHGSLKISRNPLLRVHRDIPVRSETIHEPETDPFSGPADPSDSVTGELDFDSSVYKTRKRRRLLHKSPVAARFSLDDCDEDDDTSAQKQIVSCPPLPKIMIRSDLGCQGDSRFLLPWKTNWF